MIYLDHAATTKPLPEAVRAFHSACEEWGNPSSRHFFGLSAEKTLEAARSAAAGALGAPEKSIVFTSGGTEANNLAIFGTAAKTRLRHIVSTALEHPSVREPLRELSLRGFEVEYVPPGADGRVCPGDVAAAVREDTFLVSCILCCNETGAVADIAEISKMIKNRNPGVLLHTDAVQAFLHIPFSPAEAGVDMASVSAHKVGGVKGAGALYVRPGVRLAPVMYGGGQEDGRRAGTEASPAILAFGAAIGAFRPPDAALRDYAAARLEQAGAYVVPSPDAPHIVAFALRGIPGEVAARMLNDMGICVSTGAACSKGKKSPVAAALRLPPRVSGSMLRASFSTETTRGDIDGLCAALGDIARRML